MKLLLDMNVSPLWLQAFAEAGLDAVHWASIGKADAADELIMQHARAHKLVVFTQDLDFGIALALSGEPLPSVIQVRSDDALPAGIGAQVVEAVRLTVTE